MNKTTTPGRTCSRSHDTASPKRRAALAAVLAGASLLFDGCGDSNRDSAAAAKGGGDRPAAPVTAPAAPSAPAAPPVASVPGDAATPFALPTGAGAAAAAPATPADEAWAAFEKAFGTPPRPPEGWSDKRPTEEEIAAFQKKTGEAAEKVADLARDFYVKFASDPRVPEARAHELRLLDVAVKMGHTNAAEKLAKAEKERLADPALSEDQRLELRMMAAQRSAEALISQGEEKAKAALADSARELIKEFPKREEPYQLLLSLVSDGPADEARATAKALLGGEIPESVREAAQGLMNRLERVGKPVDVQFTSVDGRKVDLTKMQGKVVLVDFWATWCGPCVAELPNVKAAYEKLNPKGFEIVGISFDQKKDALESFVAKEKMPWPQYFDGKGWGNELGQRFGISAIPAMWLIDKKGNLRDLAARDGLEEKVTKLLAEADAPAAK